MDMSEFMSCLYHQRVCSLLSANCVHRHLLISLPISSHSFQRQMLQDEEVLTDK